jgi:hypothetical protein
MMLLMCRPYTYADELEASKVANGVLSVSLNARVRADGHHEDTCT